MRILIFSLIDDWELGRLLKDKGHEILAWVRPTWERAPMRSPINQRIRTFGKKILSQTKPSGSIKPKYDTWKWLVKNNISRISCADVNASSFITFLQGQNIDLILVAMYPQIFKSPVLQIPHVGAINYHPSRLPRYAGPQPIFWMIKNGEEQAGLTIHIMTEKVDGGDILAQEYLEIGREENAGQVLQRLHYRAAQLLADTIDAIAQGRVEPKPQNLAERSYFGKKKESDTNINWSAPACNLANLLRGVQPFEPLTPRFRGRNIKVFQARVVHLENERGKPGQILFKKGGSLVVQTGEGCLDISSYEIEPFHGWINRLLQLYIPPVGAHFDIFTDEKGGKSGYPG